MLNDVLRLLLLNLREPVAQLVEHRTFNAVVAGSSPARLTIIFNNRFSNFAGSPAKRGIER
jgi:hypothetical protein